MVENNSLFTTSTLLWWSWIMNCIFPPTAFSTTLSSASTILPHSLQLSLFLSRAAESLQVASATPDADPSLDPTNASLQPQHSPSDESPKHLPSFTHMALCTDAIGRLQSSSTTDMALPNNHDEGFFVFDVSFFLSSYKPPSPSFDFSRFLFVSGFFLTFFLWFLRFHYGSTDWKAVHCVLVMNFIFCALFLLMKLLCMVVAIFLF